MKSEKQRIVAAVLFTGAMLVVVSSASCDRPSRPVNDDAVARAGGSLISPTIVEQMQPVSGHKVYVSVYSHIYHMQDSIYNLTNTLSIRNTDDANGIYVKSVKYYDTKGKLVRHYTPQPVLLPSLATLEYIVGIKDTSGGSGANFIVEWVSDKQVTDPIIECVTIGSQSQQGISFVSVGIVID